MRRHEPRRGPGDPHVGARETELATRILELIEVGPDGDPMLFDALALEVFAYQYQENPPFREYCDAQRATPSTVSAWNDVPAYPSQAFKTHVVASFPVERAVMAQMTSGTTSANQRGKIFRDEQGQRLVFAANRVMTGAYLFPDFDAGHRCRLLILAPSPRMAPSMGMAIGMEQTRLHFGTPDSTFLLDRGGVDVKSLIGALRDAQESGTPVALIGATSAFVYFFNACKDRGLTFDLPAGSRICDGGGYRGRFGVLTREDYYRLAEKTLGVPSTHCVNTLGTAESATNYFDSVLRETIDPDASARGTRHKMPPPWTRVAACSLETLAPLPPGEIGLLRHYDLANLPTVLGVQTDNLGYTDERGGFEIIGRATVTNGRVTAVPDERPVGPMGDRRVFRMLESYVNFSIDFRMKRAWTSAESTSPGQPSLELDAAGPDAQPSCPLVVDDIVAGAEDPAARRRAREALATYGPETPEADPSAEPPPTSSP